MQIDEELTDDFVQFCKDNNLSYSFYMIAIKQMAIRRLLTMKIRRQPLEYLSGSIRQKQERTVGMIIWKTQPRQIS